MEMIMKTISVVLVLLWTGLAQAAGFGVDLHSARAVGMAQTMKAHIDDASAVFYNPAGLIMGRLLDVQIGDTLIIPSLSVKDSITGATFTTQNQVVAPPHVYAAYALNDDISLGIGMFSLFGLVVPWAPEWPGRFQTIRTELKSYFINPEVAVRIGDRVRVGAGLQIVRGTAQLDRALQFGPGQEGKVMLGGGAWGFGGNGGVIVDIIPRMLTFGATYRSAVKLDITGSAHFTGIPPEFQGTIHDQRAQTTVHLPQTFGFGLALWPIPNLRLSAEADYTGWQSVHDLTITFPDTPPTPPNTLGPLDTFLPKRWSHAWLFRTGGELNVTEQWRLRTGIMYDMSPSPSDTITPDIPDANRINIGAGVGYRWYNFNFDLGYQLVIFLNNQSTSPTIPIGPGTYNGTANILSFTVGYRI
jgi:long-chain fatty acid transport protein